MCILTLLLVLTATVAWSQVVSGTILGIVTDASGAVVPNAKTTITETQTGIKHTSVTNRSGNYYVPTLPPSQYAEKAEAQGFKTETRNNVTLLVNTNTRADIQLQPGAVTETVEVTGAAPLLQTDSAGTGDKIGTQMLQDLPLSTNRNFQSRLNLVLKAPQVIFQHSQFFNASGSLQTEVNGQMRMGNNFMMEGTDDDDRTGLLQVNVPLAETIQKVGVSLSGFDVVFAVVNVIMKSGTNNIQREGLRIPAKQRFQCALLLQSLGPATWPITMWAAPSESRQEEQCVLLRGLSARHGP